MRNSTRRRATVLLLILAILVGPAASVMSAAATMPLMAMTEADGDDACKGCLPGETTVADCGAACISLPAIIAPVAAFSSAVERSPWQRHDEQIGRHSTEPPTAPPRSVG